MLLYVVKFSGCLFCFLAFYKLFLEREKVHVFKRWYLLLSVLLSVIIPIITFTNYIEVTTKEPLITLDNVVVSSNELQKQRLVEILWVIYSLGVIVFSARLISNIIQLLKRIAKNPTVKHKPYTNVLLSENEFPYTWFRYIFLNKSQFENKTIPEAVLLHEQTHAKQLHALDVLIIELIAVVFWFNPLLYIIKKAVKLNHEFLADEAVLVNGFNTSNYQQLLLNFSIKEQTISNDLRMVNAINYSSIKKRFKIMNAKTSRTKKGLLVALLFPLMVGLVHGFSNTKTEYLNKNSREITFQDGATADEIAEYNTLATKYNSMSKSKLVVKAEEVERLNYLYSKMTVSQRKQAEPLPVLPPKPPVPPTPPTAPVIGSADMKNAECYLNNKRVSFKQINKLNPNLIKSVNVVKDNGKNQIHVITKSN